MQFLFLKLFHYVLYQMPAKIYALRIFSLCESAHAYGGQSKPVLFLRSHPSCFGDGSLTGIWGSSELARLTRQWDPGIRPSPSPSTGIISECHHPGFKQFLNIFCMYVWVCTCHSAYMEVRGWLTGVGSFLPSCRSQGSNSCCQPWQQSL